MRPILQARVPFLLLWLLWLLWVAGGGCVWWPAHGYLHRSEIRASQLQTFVEGLTSRAEVVLALGEPEWISDDERRLLYWVSEVHSWMSCYVVVDAATMYFATDRYHLFEFDTDGLLRRHRCREQSAEHGPYYADWEPRRRVTSLFDTPGSPR